MISSLMATWPMPFEVSSFYFTYFVCDSLFSFVSIFSFFLVSKFKHLTCTLTLRLGEFKMYTHIKLMGLIFIVNISKI